MKKLLILALVVCGIGAQIVACGCSARRANKRPRTALRR